jgi:phosphotransferase system HPr-like phosphotransfer protein
VDSVITVRVEGEDACHALDHIVEMIESKFD